MTPVRFLQIHTLHSYTAALLNRDDSGLSKRLFFGGTLRTRISSQCLKRHWRKPDGDKKELEPFALSTLSGFVESYRSRETVTKRIAAMLAGKYPEDVLNAIEQWFQFAVYGGKSDNKPKKRGVAAKFDSKNDRPTLLIGTPEIEWLAQQYETLAIQSGGDADRAFSLTEEWIGLKKKGESDFQKAMAALRSQTALPAGLAGALFGRMVTSDPKANIDAPIHVAHAFTVHTSETESDYFTAVDDLKADEDDSGADTIQETELTSGLFYGYVVIDLPGLIANCGEKIDGKNARDLAARIVHNLLYLIAEVSPGAKLGSTAPYGRADFLLIEAGDRQPRSLAGAYRKAIAPDLEQAVRSLANHLKDLDAIYETGEQRRYLTLSEASIESAEKASLADLATWAQDRAGEAQ
jgi:CRISPR system Cascade subunit CasC